MQRQGDGAERKIEEGQFESGNAVRHSGVTVNLTIGASLSVLPLWSLAIGLATSCDLISLIIDLRKNYFSAFWNRSRP